jgi:hypothetical protein
VLGVEQRQAAVLRHEDLEPAEFAERLLAVTEVALT